MLEQIILGIIQGVAEWLPISSEGIIILAETHLFNYQGELSGMIQKALFLHMGSLLAAIVYFRKDIIVLIKALCKRQGANEEDKKTLLFLITATGISGVVGILFLLALRAYSVQFLSLSKFITCLVGVCLLATGYLQLKAHKGGLRQAKNLSLLDGILLGLAQGLAALPGLSRSGLTVSALLLRKFDKNQSLRLSFLLSIPIILLGNIILNAGYITFSIQQLTGLFFSFFFGLITIHGLLKIAERVNFGYFVIGVGLFLLLAAVL